jgi:hypothetical protein
VGEVLVALRESWGLATAKSAAGGIVSGASDEDEDQEDVNVATTGMAGGLERRAMVAIYHSLLKCIPVSGFRRRGENAMENY